MIYRINFLYLLFASVLMLAACSNDGNSDNNSVNPTPMGESTDSMTNLNALAMLDETDDSGLIATEPMELQLSSIADLEPIEIQESDTLKSLLKRLQQ